MDRDETLDALLQLEKHEGWELFLKEVERIEKELDAEYLKDGKDANGNCPEYIRGQRVAYKGLKAILDSLIEDLDPKRIVDDTGEGDPR